MARHLRVQFTAKMSFDRLFRSNTLIYRPLEKNPEDRAFYQQTLLSDPSTYARGTNALLRPPTLESIDKSLGGIVQSLLAVMICLPMDAQEKEHAKPTPVGWVHLDAHPLSRHHRSCTLGITMAASYQGKGYGTEALKWTLDWAFGVAGMHAVRLSCFSFNERAVRLYERLGFVREGVNREAYYYDCIWHDRILFSMLEKEWIALKSK